MKLNPIEAFEQVKMMAILLDTRYIMGKKSKVPGAPVLDSSPEVREALKGLKSDDLKNIRADAIFGTKGNQQ